MTQIRIDKDAYNILIETQKKMMERGIGAPDHSDAIRELKRRKNNDEK